MLHVVFGLSDEDNVTLVKLLARQVISYWSRSKRHISVEGEKVLFFKEILLGKLLLTSSAPTRMDIAQMLRTLHFEA